MGSTKGYLNFILEQLENVEGITTRMMMGEYILYHHDRIAAYICDDRLLVKPVKAVLNMMPDAPMEPPYDGAKPMVLVENVDDRSFLTELFEAMYPELPEPKKKRKK